MSQALRKLTAVCSKNNCIIIFTNQLREKIGFVMGNPETTTGGRALKFYASVRLEIRRGEAIKQGDKQVGNRTKVKVVKNKVAPPFKNTEFDIVFGEGISKVGDILDLAADTGIVNKSGSWYSYKEERLGQGRETVKTALTGRPELVAEIEDAVRNHFGLMKKGATPVEEPKVEEKKPAAKKSSKKSKDEEVIATLDIDEAEIDNIIQELGLEEFESDE